MNLTEIILTNAHRLLIEEGWVQDTSLRYIVAGEERVEGGSQEDLYRLKDVCVEGRCANEAIDAAAYDIEMDFANGAEEDSEVIQILLDEPDWAVALEEATQKARELLAFIVEDPEEEFGYDPRAWPRVEVDHWNDAAGRTFSEIQDGFIEARKEAQYVRDV